MTSKREVGFSEDFLKAVKRLRKKYRNIDADLKSFIETLENGETPGDQLQGTGDYLVYKARLASRDMQRGKSGAFRVIYYLQVETLVINLILYPKTEREDITTNEILDLIKSVIEPLDDDPE